MGRAIEEDSVPVPQSIRSSLGCVLLACALGPRVHDSGQTTQPAASTLPPPVVLTAEQDHQRMMDLLHITSLRPGADGMHPDAPNAANYDESKANPYPNLPAPLVLKNGRKVTTAEMWWRERRPEIVEDFDREIYGRVPKTTPKVNWEIASTVKETNGDVPVITKKLIGHVDNSSYPLITVDIQLTLSTPANATGPVPLIMEFGFDPAFMREMRARMEARGIKMPPPGPGEPGGSGPTWQQQVLANGWGYATLIPTSAQADNGAGLTQGIIGLCNKGQPRKPGDWGALRAWAWAASRALDYFETDKSVDARQVGLEGHSRYGKATLVAMAYDPRLAIAFVSSSGEGGAKLHRRNFGELVENVAGSGEYHWMAGNFLKYAGPLTWNDLPVDSHELIALCAPRPVFISAGATQGDGWVDAKGMFLAAAGAGPVYRLLGKKDLGVAEFPPIETPLIDGDIAFRQHSGGHTPGPNWPTFLKFAERYLTEPPVVQGLVGHAQTTSVAESAKPTFSVNISAVQDVVTVGSAVMVNIVLTNTSDHKIGLAWERTSGGRNFQVNVRNSEGESAQLVPRSWVDTNGRRHIRFGAGSAYVLYLEPGQTKKDFFDACDYYILNRPGKYTIQLQRVDDESKVVVKSNTITVTVAQP